MRPDPTEARARSAPAAQGSSSGEVLLVDDEQDALQAMQALLEGRGYRVRTASDGRAALAALVDSPPDVLVTDLKMPELDGLELLRQAKAADDDLPVIVVTADAGLGSAIAAMKAGALHYLQKPIRIDELVMQLELALAHRGARREVKALRGRLGEKLRPANMVGESPAMQAVWKVVAQVAPTRASVLLTGESGTGKELVAQALHEQSPRRQAPFVKLHCAALAESLLESELFGHEKGAFSGATGRREGRFKKADGGTLLLDEIGEISPAIQVKLLRFLQERSFERVGSNETVEVDVRLIAATNRDLADDLQKGRFREDLFYRLNVVTIELPPLRLRGGDALALAEHFLRRYALENGKAIASFTPEAQARVAEYAWPGNVRELENAVERAVVVCEASQIGAGDLPAVLASPRSGAVRIPGSTMAEIERHAVLATLDAVGGSTYKAARLLGLSVRTIQYRLHEYGVRDPAGPSTSDLPPSPAPRARGVSCCIRRSEAKRAPTARSSIRFERRARPRPGPVPARAARAPPRAQRETPMPFALPTHWWSLAARGALALLFGSLVVAKPEVTLATFVMLFGWYALVDGGFNALGAFRAAREGDLWWPFVLEGMASLGVGLLLVSQPDFSWKAALDLVAIWALATGALELAAAARLHTRIEGEWLLALAGVASVALGVVLMLAPGLDPLKAVFWLGAYTLFFGGVLIALGLRLRGEAHGHAPTALGPPLKGL